MEQRMVKGQFIWKSPDEQHAAIASIRERIATGYFHRPVVWKEIAEKISPHFSGQVDC